MQHFEHSTIQRQVRYSLILLAGGDSCCCQRHLCLRIWLLNMFDFMIIRWLRLCTHTYKQNAHKYINVIRTMQRLVVFFTVVVLFCYCWECHLHSNAIHMWLSSVCVCFVLLWCESVGKHLCLYQLIGFDFNWLTWVIHTHTHTHSWAIEAYSERRMQWQIVDCRKPKIKPTNRIRSICTFSQAIRWVAEMNRIHGR